MQRTIEEVDRDIHTLCQQIAAALNGKMSPKDKRIVIEGFGKQKQNLDAERARLLGNDQEGVFNCKVGKTVAIPEFHDRAGVQELKEPDRC